MSADTPIRPTFHHFNLKTARLQELIDWYATVVGAEVTFQDATGAWLTTDVANHRIALLCFPGFADDPDRETRTGMHHSAFEYNSFTDLNASYQRLREAGIEPDICIDHGMTLSYYYKDPDGNRVELPPGMIRCEHPLQLLEMLPRCGSWSETTSERARRAIP